MTAFCHLHVHTEYTLLKSTVRISALAEAVRARGMEAVAITDHGVLFGWVPFYEACTRAGVHPILGMELAVVFGEGDRTANVVLLAEDDDGYASLVKLSTLAQLSPAARVPSVTKEALSAHARGLIALSGGVEGEIARHILSGDVSRAVEAAIWYRHIFGPERFYLELADHGTPEEQKMNAHLVELGRRLGIPLVATNDVHYLDEREAPVQEVLMAIGAGTKLSDPLRPKLEGRGYDLAAPDDFARRRPWPKEALENTVRIARRCRARLPDATPKMPRFPLPASAQAEGLDAPAYLRQEAEAGARRRYGSPLPEPVAARLEHELSVITHMGFSDYFLIVADVVAAAKRRGIPVGPGRGSAAGSLVAYALGITDVDPLRYDLLFERFLNPERQNLPDIDIDFADDRRDEVLAYVRETYGAERVANIGTFGTMAARMSVRDAGRVLGLATNDIDRLAKRIPAQPGMTIARALEEDAALRREIEANPEWKRLFDIARHIEGLPRHVSTHAAGLVLSPEPLDRLVPLYPGAAGAVTQFPMDDLARIGLVKIDFLGLRNLTILDRTVRAVERETGAAPDLRRLPLDDAKTFALLSRGETDGVFQLESAGMRRVLMELKPSGFDDIVAVIALYRPGPMEHISDYVRAKHGHSAVRYPHPALRPILSPTYGVVVYQEQIMRIAETLSGYSLGEADLLRRAVSKKDRATLEAERARFVARAEARGVLRSDAEAVYDLIVRFADYGFNKSHAVAYALIAYQTAYLKAHYPLFYMTELLNSTLGDTDKTAAYVDAARRMGIRLLGPDLNASDALHRIDGQAIRFGLLAVKNVGRQAAEAILRAREAGPFKSLIDLLERTDARQVSRRAVEALIFAGAFDAIDRHRARLLADLDDALRYAEAVRAHKDQGVLFEQDDKGAAFGDSPPRRGVERHPPSIDASSGAAKDGIEPFSPREIARYEREYLGVALSDHPLLDYAEVWRDPAITRLIDLADMPPGATVTVAAELLQLRPRTTRRGEPMASLYLDDLSARAWAVVYPAAYRRLRFDLSEGGLYALRGRVIDGGEAPRLAVEHAWPLAAVKARHKLKAASGSPLREVFIRVRAADRLTGKLEALKDVLLQHPGDVPVYLVDEGRSVRALSDKYRITPSLSFIKAVQALLGPEAVVVHTRKSERR
ncbi:MAG: DNA polymerase III subunit alpha [Hydrogenibacillus sp.]|nr:DNA polymerase III subunit alpha [Hydrogenibacillus sp.]